MISVYQEATGAYSWESARNRRLTACCLNLNHGIVPRRLPVHAGLTSRLSSNGPHEKLRAAASGQSHGRSPKKGVPNLVLRSTGRARPRTSQREISCGFWPYAFIRTAHWSCTHSSGLRAMAGYSGNNRERRDLRSGVGGCAPNTTNLTYLAGLPPLVRLLIAGVLLDYGRPGHDGQDTSLESDVHASGGST